MCQIFGMTWSPDGKLLATVCKDGKVRIYDPRKSSAPLQVWVWFVSFNLKYEITHEDICGIQFLCHILKKNKSFLLFKESDWLFSFSRKVQVQRATEELVLCGCVRESTCWCQGLTGKDFCDSVTVHIIQLAVHTVKPSFCNVKWSLV